MLDRRQTYSVIVTCGSIVLAAVMIGAAAGWAYYQQSKIRREFDVPKQMPTSRERGSRPVDTQAELPLFDPHSYLAEIQAGSNPADVASRHRDTSLYRVRWTIEGWLSTGQAWGRFEIDGKLSEHELSMAVPKGSKVGDKLDTAARFRFYHLTPNGGMRFSFQRVD